MSSAFKTIDFLNEIPNPLVHGHHIHQNNLSVSISNNNSYFDSDFFHLNNSNNGILSRDECDSPKKKKFRQSDSPFLIPSLLPMIDTNGNSNILSISSNNIINGNDESFNIVKLNNSVNNNFKVSPNSFIPYSNQHIPNIPNFLLSCFDNDYNSNLFKNSPIIDENDSQVNYNFQNCIINNSNNSNISINNLTTTHNNNSDEQNSDTITPQESNTPLSSNEIIDDKIVNNQQPNQVDENQINNDLNQTIKNNNNNKPSFIYSIDQQQNKELVCANSNSIIIQQQQQLQQQHHDTFDNESVEGGSSIEGDDEEEEDETTWNPLFFIKQLPIGMIESIVPRPKLPPKDAFAPKITLVLDLDETLVHCSTEPIDEPHLTFPVTFNNIEYQVFAKKRPFFEEFLLQMSSQFELIIFTASQEIYARTLLDIIDPNNRITHRLYRDSCLFLKGNYLKDLRVLNRDLNHVVIIDNSPQSFGFQVDNGIPIESWFEDENDKELLSLVPFLESLKTVDDVRPFIRDKYWRGIC